MKREASPTLKGLRVAANDDRAAVELLEARRWGAAPACPRCGDLSVYQMRDAQSGERNRDYRWRCRGCRRMFTVRTGTVMEESRLPLRVWCYAFWRACSSKKGVSALQISRKCEISYKTALYLMHRIRAGVAELAAPKLSGIEADETYVGEKPRNRRPGGQGQTDKTPVVGVVERGGDVRFRMMERVTAKGLAAALAECVEPDARLMTDESNAYTVLGRAYGGGHETVNHGRREYVRDDAYTNTIESALPHQARRLRDLPLGQQEAPAALPGRIRVPLQHAEDGRRRARRGSDPRLGREARHPRGAGSRIAWRWLARRTRMARRAFRPVSDK